MIRSLTRIFLVFSCAALVNACIKNKVTDLSVTYNGTLAFAVASLGFTLEEVLKDDTVLTIEADSAISLMYREDNFFSLAVDDVLENVTDQLRASKFESFEAGVVEIDDISQMQTIAFSEFVDNFQDPTLKTFLQANDGNPAVVAPFAQTVNTTTDLPSLEDFEFINVESGSIVVTVENGFFIDLENLEVTIEDKVTGTPLGTLQFSFIPAGGMDSQALDLQGVTINNSLGVSIPMIETPGSGGQVVTIDLNSLLTVKFSTQNMKIFGGRVKLPETEFENENILIDFDTEDDQQIHRVDLETVTTRYSIKSEVQTPITVVFEFPHVIRNNQPVQAQINVNYTGLTDSITGTLDFSNSSFLLDQDPNQPFNRMEVRSRVFIPAPTGGLVEFSANDKVTINFEIADFNIQRVFGYFGQFEETIDPGTIDLDFDFSIFDEQSDPLLFDNPTMRIYVENSIGVPFQVALDVDAEGYFGDQASLDPPLLEFNYPDMNNIGSTAVTDIVLDKDNSNIVQLLSIFPKMLTYSGTGTVNPAGNTGEENFITKDSRLSVSAEFELPFRFSTKNLVYRDTGEALNLDLEEGLTVDDIEVAELKILFRNGLPMQTMLNIIALDAASTETRVVENVVIPAAAVNDQGRVTPDLAAEGELFVTLTPDQVHQLEQAAQNIYEIRFQTFNDGTTPVGMYTDYAIDLDIGLKVTFDVQ